MKKPLLSSKILHALFLSILLSCGLTFNGNTASSQEQPPAETLSIDPIVVNNNLSTVGDTTTIETIPTDPNGTTTTTNTANPAPTNEPVSENITTQEKPTAVTPTRTTPTETINPIRTTPVEVVDLPVIDVEKDDLDTQQASFLPTTPETTKCEETTMCTEVTKKNSDNQLKGTMILIAFGFLGSLLSGTIFVVLNQNRKHHSAKEVLNQSRARLKTATDEELKKSAYKTLNYLAEINQHLQSKNPNLVKGISVFKQAIVELELYGSDATVTSSKNLLHLLYQNNPNNEFDLQMSMNDLQNNLRKDLGLM